MSGHSTSTIQRIIHYWLDHPPTLNTLCSSARYLVCDGTYVKGRKGLFLAMDAQSHEVVKGVVNISENHTDLLGFFRSLQLEQVPINATLDGNPAIKYAVQAVWPTTQIQRCLVHIQRQGLMWCRYRPKQASSIDLRPLFRRVVYIETPEDRDKFLNDLRIWEATYGKAIDDSSNRGRVFSDIKRARSMLIKATPDMFRYLNDSAIPRSTNLIEGYFGRMKQRYRRHCGLAAHRLEAYYLWHLKLIKR